MDGIGDAHIVKRNEKSLRGIHGDTGGIQGKPGEVVRFQKAHRSRKDHIQGGDQSDARKRMEKTVNETVGGKDAGPRYTDPLRLLWIRQWQAAVRAAGTLCRKASGNHAFRLLRNQPAEIL